MPSTPVTGTVSVSNFPATQPVSGTVTANSTLQAGTNYVGKVRLTDGTNDATLRSLTSSKSLDVSIVDGTGSQITSFGGGTQYANAAAQATPTGTVALGYDGANVRALSTDTTGKLNITGSISATNPSVGTDGSAIPTSSTLLGASDGTNLQPLQVDGSKNLKVNVSTLPALATGANTIGAISNTAFTANAGTNLNTSALALDATLTGGNQVAQLKTAAKGTTVAGQPTSVAVDANTQSLHTSITNTSIPVTGTFYQSTQPISGTVTSNIGTTNGLALDATLTGGTQKAVARGGAKGTTAAADLTSNPIDANTQALHVDGSKVTQPVSIATMPSTPVTGTFYQATQPISAASLPLPSGAALDATLTSGTQQTKITDGTNTMRIPTTFKTVTATASGDTALWTPTTGKKFRLMKYMIEVTADCATASGAEIDIVLRDATTGLAASFSLYVPATAVTTNPGAIGVGWVDLGNGILSALANNVLNVNLSAALTSGKVRVVAIGTEE